MQSFEKITRTINILDEITQNDFSGDTAQITLHSVSPVSPTDLFVNQNTTILFSEAELISLRMNVFARSLTPAEIIIPSLGDSPQQVLANTRSAEMSNPRFQFTLYLFNPNAGQYEAGSLYLNNRPPYYIVDLMPYLSSQQSFFLHGDTLLQVEIKDAGYGTFTSEDKVTFVGSLREYSWVLVETDAIS